jgi:signal transduction histidine kinase
MQDEEAPDGMRDPLAWVPVKYKLTGAFAALVFAAVGIGGYLVSGPTRRLVEDETLAHLESRSAVEALLLERQLTLVARRLQDFASDGLIRTELDRLGGPHAPEARLPLVRHLRENKQPLVPGLVALAAFDARGEPISAGDAASGPLALGDEPVRVSGLCAGPGGLDPWLEIAVPVLSLDRRRRVGALAARIDAARWVVEARGALPATGAEEDESVRIVLEDGAGRALEIPSGLGRSGAAPPLRLADGAAAVSDPGAVLARSFAIPIAGGWKVTVARDAAAVFVPIARLKMRFFALGLALAAACGLVFFFPLRFLIRPLQALEAAARRIERGDYAGRVPVESQDEIGHLAGAFNHMAAAVEERTRGLERAARDIEARKEELRLERDRLGLVIRSMSDGLVFLDASGRVALANEAAAPLVRSLDGPAGGLAWRSCAGQHPGTASCADCLRVLESEPFACVLEAQGETVLEVRSTALPSAGRSGSAGRVLVSRDITERVAQEARQTHQERLAVVGEVAAVVAHELNNPLAAISMFVQMLQSELSPESPFREHADVIARNAETCKRAIRGLLDFASPAAPEEGEVDLHALLREVGHFLAPLRQRAKLDIAYELEAKDPVVIGDEIQLRQVFVNLVLNAIQAAGGAGRRIRVATAEADGGRAITADVEDDGPGVPPEIRERIFDAFFTTKRPGRGTGLGLPISRRIAEAHGGSLELVHAEAGRTVFRVMLLREGRRAASFGRIPLRTAGLGERASARANDGRSP